MNRISTKIDSFDDILHGGIPEGSLVLIAGMPGTGKTILANQIIYNIASFENKVLYLTTLSEPQVKILKFQQEFSFFDINKIQQSIYYQDMGSIIRQDGYEKTLDFIDGLLQKYEPAIVVIDTIRTLAEIIPSKTKIREFILDLSIRLTTWGCTSLFLGEYSETEIQNRPESAIADGIIYLSGTEEKKYQKRYMRILKMRGTSIDSGEIFFKITGDGIRLYPRLNTSRYLITDKNIFNAHISTGISNLNKMMEGGLPKGTNTLISGSTGTGKTILSVNFAYEGLKNGESVVYTSFEESREQLFKSARSIGIDLETFTKNGQLKLIYVCPVEMDVDEHIYQVQEIVKATNATRIIIDSISSFELGILDKVKYTDYIWSLANFLKSYGVTSIMNHEIHHSINIDEITKYGISYIADNIIMLLFKEVDHDVKRYLRIVKMRSVCHDTRLKEYHIKKDGIFITDIKN